MRAAGGVPQAGRMPGKKPAMSQPVLIKVYGSLFPADEAILQTLLPIASLASPQESAPIILEGDLLLISFEGVYFPLEDLAECLKGLLKSGMEGKIDFLDIENWKMTRYLIRDGKISHNSVGLNHVMDYSGF